MLKPTSYMFEKWSDQAVECYRRRCHCTGCSLESFCTQQFRDNTYLLIPMKWAVLMTYARLGEPKEEGNYDEFDESRD